MGNSKAQEEKRQERKYLIKVMETVQFLARQGLAFQGNTSLEDDNFSQLMKFRAKHDSELLERLSCSGKKKYTHADYQNELLIIMANQVLQQQLMKIKENSVFSLMCDEYTDIGNKEQLSLCIRSVTQSLCVQEDFLGFYELTNIKSDTVVSAIKDMLIRMQLSLSNCRGQMYDGASNMMGKKSGVATQISRIQPRALVNHCYGHSLSLSVKDITSKCKTLGDVMGTAGEICILIKFSPKREKMLGAIQENIEGDLNTEEYAQNMACSLDKLCVTRWTVRASCFQKILMNYNELLKLWELCLVEKLTVDVRARIVGCNSNMQTFSFYFGLSLGQKLYSLTDNLSKALQNQKMAAINGQRNANLTVKTFEGMRNDFSFELFYGTVVAKAKQHTLLEEPCKPRKRNRPNYATMELLDGCEGTSAYYPSSVQEHYKIIYFEALDTMIHSIKVRFDQPSFKTFCMLENLLLNAIHSKDYGDELNHLQEIYGSDINIAVLETELQLMETIFKGITTVCWDDIYEVLRELPNEEQLLIPNTILVCKLILVNPATTASPERSFSLARRLKTWSRSSMSQKRFNSLSILSHYKESTDNLDLLKVGDYFVALYEDRFSTFGKFNKSDFHI